MFEPKVKNEQTELLMQAVLTLETTEDAYRFFEDICTIAEFKSMAQRLEVAVLLRKHVTYQKIVQKTGASSATISRVNRALTYGANGYNHVLDAMEKDDPQP
ncbi:MAG: YerC/YecD family TrpR-related protein [Aristaeellaceae bacterium]